MKDRYKNLPKSFSIKSWKLALLEMNNFTLKEEKRYDFEEVVDSPEESLQYALKNEANSQTSGLVIMQEFFMKALK